MTTSIQNALDDKIRKLTQLRDLLSDPEIAKIARNILQHGNAAATAVDAGAGVIVPPQIHSTTRKARKKKRGTLVKKVSEIIKTSTAPLTAKDVANALVRDGFDFRAEDKYVSVSKALRSLAKQEKIGYKRGEHPKAAISYTRLPSLIPVQERTH